MAKDIISVSQLTGAIKTALETSFGTIRVQGEISNFNAHSSGHRYFTLKDEGAQISCTMWRSRQLNFMPSNGMKVIVSGHITVYPPRGNYQIECDSLTPVGLGDLYLAYEELKRKLEESGYFDPSRKKNIPRFPLKIGVATSPTGAAVKDIISTIGRRNPLCEIYFRPTKVQGDGSSADIVKAIQDLDSADTDVIIIGRGGGSIEDLWAFNEESTANAIFKCNKPIISAVGHETDFTIADYIADLRAATPTAAAEIVTSVTIENLLDFIDSSCDDMTSSVTNIMENYKTSVNNFTGSYAFRRIYDRITMFSQLTDDLQNRASKSMHYQLRHLLQKIDSLHSECKLLNPDAPLKKGFALLKRKGKVLGKYDPLNVFDSIEIIRETEKAKAYITDID